MGGTGGRGGCHRGRDGGSALIEELLTRLAAWPPLAVYAMVVLAAVIENILPPAPADVAITFAAFLSQRGLTTPVVLFVVAWLGSVTGAISVYFVARHYGQAFVQSRVGRRLITPSAIVVVEREYLRFGLIGLFVARLLPGVRSFTAPFAGLVGLPFWRAILPMAVASGLWYGLLVWLGSQVGANWPAVSRMLQGLNQTLLVLLVVLAVATGAWVLSRRRHRKEVRSREEMQSGLRAYPGMEERAMADPAAAAVAALLLETTRAGSELSDEDLSNLEHHLRIRWHLTEDQPVDRTSSQASVIRIIESMEPAARLGLARRLWEQAFSDRVIEPHEDHVMERVARLLGLSSEDLRRARHRTEP